MLWSGNWGNFCGGKNYGGHNILDIRVAFIAGLTSVVLALGPAIKCHATFFF